MKHDPPDVWQSADNVRRIARDMLDGLAHLHESDVLHRDGTLRDV